MQRDLARQASTLAVVRPGATGPAPTGPGRTGHAERESRSELVYEQLRAAIMRLELWPSESFSETDLVDRLQTSRAPVRDALARLRREGLVQSSPRAGHRVAPMTVKDAHDLFNLRTLLEAETAALAALAGGDVEHLRELDRLCSAHYDPREPDSIAEFLQRNAAFHLAVARLADNNRMTAMVARAVDERYMHLGLRLTPRAADIVHEHQELVAAIVAGDADAARRVALAQAQSSHRMVLDALLNSAEVLTVNLGAPTGGRR
jgi:DNA-binding GntR family transcriptional regulator